ncbi:reverse transcriptase domain-containing protein [Tanacetum coccineum]
MTWHATGKSIENGKMQHPVDGKAWKNFDDMYLDFAAEKRNTINDFPARSRLSGWSGQSYMACPTYNKDTPSKHVLSKTTYVGHRRFLKKKHRGGHWNSMVKPMIEILLENLPLEDILTQLNRLPTCEKRKHPSNGGVKIKRNSVVELNWTKRFIFYEIEYWYFLTLKHNLDFMHIERNVLESFLGTLLMNDKSKDTTKARQDLKTLGIRKELWFGKNQNLKDESQWIDILCNLKQIYPLAFFDIMIHLVIYLPEETLEGGPIPYRALIRLDHKEMKKVIWYILQNSPVNNTYLAEFERKFHNSDMKQELPCWFELQICRRYIDKDPTLSDELFALACGPLSIPILVNSCVVNGMRFVVHSRDDRRTTQNNGICPPGEKDGEMYYGQLEKFSSFCISRSKLCCSKLSGSTLATKEFANGGVIVIEDDHNVIHDNNSSNLALSNSLNGVDFATLNIDGQSTEVEAPPDIIAMDEDDDFIDDEDDVPHDLADFDDEMLANAVDDDDEAVTVVYFNVSSSSSTHGGDGGGEPPLNPRQIGHSCRGVGGQKATRGGRGGGKDGGRKGVRKETMILALKKDVDEYGPLKIKFEWNDQGMMLQIGPNTVWWSNFIGELVRDFRCNTLPGVLSRSPRRRTSKEDSCFEIHEYPSLISTFYDTHTYDSVWAHEEAWIQYEEIIRLRDLGADTPTGVPYIEEHILAMVRKGKQRWHIPRIGRKVVGKGKTLIFDDQPRGTYTDDEIDDMLASRDNVVKEYKEEAKRQRREIDLLRRSEIDGGIGTRGGGGSGGGGDDQSGGDEDADMDDDEGH